MKRLKNQDGLEHVRGEQCKYPRKASPAGSTTIGLRPAGWIGNSPIIIEQLRVTKDAEWKKVVYKQKLLATQQLQKVAVAAILRGLQAQWKSNGWLFSSVTIGASCDEPIEWIQEECEGIRDNITGKELDPEKVREARREELEFMDKLNVMTEVPVEQCWLETNAKPIGTKWIDINKGDGEKIVVRSRFL